MSEDTIPDHIVVNVFVEEELPADRADLHVTVAGSALFSGSEALKKARELAALVTDLRAAGIEEKHIFVENVTAETSSGILSKSSRASYDLRVRCADLSKLADAVGAITGAKTAELSHIEWGYDEDDARRTAWLVACAKLANTRAQAIADALGVQLGGVWQFSPVEEGSDAARVFPSGPAAARGGGMVKMRKSYSEELGMAMMHKKRVRTLATVRYHVAKR